MKTITSVISINYINQIDEITNDDIEIIKKTLSPLELSRLNSYLKAMGDNKTNKRTFLFLCNLLDFATFKK